MSAGIQKHDKGVVWGTTWHRLPQYVQQDKAVSYEQSLEVMDYPIEKRPLFLSDGKQVRAWAIVRADQEAVLVDHVGESFTLLNNKSLLEYIHQNFILRYSDLKIESVGTLWNGAVCFLNLKLDEFQVKGDQSNTISRLMYYNPLGKGSYQVCAHDIRVVCANTLRMASAQATASNSLRKISHTRNAASKIEGHLIDLAELKLGLKEHIELLNELTLKEVDSKELKKFFDKLLPTTAKPHEAAFTRVLNKREEIEDLMDQEESLDNNYTRYGLLNAVTNYADHQEPREGQDEAQVMWDGIVGSRSEFKSKALAILSSDL